jgi:hypothetical protein
MGNRKSDMVEKVKKGKRHVILSLEGQTSILLFVLFFFNVKEDYSLDTFDSNISFPFSLRGGH